jgi:hypothetical protein
MTLLSSSPFTAPTVAAGPGPPADVVGAGLDVPLVTGGSVRYANLDYAASAPALRAVADRVTELLPLYSSVHRGAGYASAVCASAYESARATLASFTGARPDDVVVFTRNTTDAQPPRGRRARARRAPRHGVPGRPGGPVVGPRPLDLRRSTHAASTSRPEPRTRGPEAARRSSRQCSRWPAAIADGLT